MASLIQVRDLLALRGRMEAAQISQTLNTPQPTSGELTAMATWSVQYLYPIMDRLMAENGPFKGCQPDERHRKGEHKDESAPHPGRVLPTTPPPPGLVGMTLKRHFCH